jgi:dolichyl-phosphate beta-glucosyltransferase
MQPLVSLIFPAYNEAARIERTVRQAGDYFRSRGIAYEIIVSADGNDSTREIASGLVSSIPSITVIGSVQRRGKGLGIREAVMLAKGSIIGFADADDKTPIEELDKFLPCLERDFDIVIGSRAHPQAVIERYQPWYRQLGSKAFTVTLHAIVGLQEIMDTQCGFKFFKSAAAHALFNRQQINGYMFDVEVLYLAKKWGFRIEQIPVKWRDDGDSRLNLVAGNIRNGLDLLRIRWMHRNLRLQDREVLPLDLIQ